MTEPFIFANGQTAHSSKDLIQLCQDFPTDGIRYLLREDLEKWLSYIGDNQNAQYASEARNAAVDDAKKLDSFLSNLQKVSKKAEPSKIASNPVAVKELEVKNVAVKTKQLSKSSVINSSEAKTSVGAKTSSDQKASPKSKSKNNLFHWIADFFRS